VTSVDFPETAGPQEKTNAKYYRNVFPAWPNYVFAVFNLSGMRTKNVAGCDDDDDGRSLGDATSAALRTTLMSARNHVVSSRRRRRRQSSSTYATTEAAAAAAAARPKGGHSNQCFDCKAPSGRRSTVPKAGGCVAIYNIQTGLVTKTFDSGAVACMRLIATE
jgi:hypothetical protein